MATSKKKHLRRQNVRNIQGAPLDAHDIALELNKEINGSDRFEADTPRPETVVDPTQPTEKEIKISTTTSPITGVYNTDRHIFKIKTGPEVIKKYAPYISFDIYLSQ